MLPRAGALARALGALGALCENSSSGKTGIQFINEAQKQSLLFSAQAKALPEVRGDKPGCPSRLGMRAEAAPGLGWDGKKSWEQIQ